MTYCFSVWRPRLRKDINKFEKVQRLGTKYILNDYTRNYRDRLIALDMLPLSMMFELNDVTLLIQPLRNPALPGFDFVTFNCSFNTRSQSHHKLQPCTPWCFTPVVLVYNRAIYTCGMEYVLITSS